MKIWEKADIQSLIERNDVAVERAVVAIYNRQTEDEKRVKETKYSNGVGFTSVEAQYGSYLAQWILAGRRLTGYHLKRARGMMKRYHRQLAEIANAKRPTNI